MHALPPPHLAPLLAVLRAPTAAASLGDRDWDRVLRMARHARLHGVLAARVEQAGVCRLPGAVAAQLEAARREAEFARQMVLVELTAVRRVLAAAGIEPIVLKGAAYIVQQLDCAAGRLPSDLDLLLTPAELEHAEQRLGEAGWRSPDLDPYDQRYYRRWAHQIPPLRASGHVTEVDLHHALLPPRGRLRIPLEPLRRASIRLDEPDVRVLSPADQVLHAVVHLFVDSDCSNRLRDLVDIGALVRQFSARQSGFAAELRARAVELGCSRALDHAQAFMSAWLEVEATGPARPSSLADRAVRGLIAQRLGPPDPDSLPRWSDLRRSALVARSLCLRLPPHLLALHVATKARRGI